MFFCFVFLGSDTLMLYTEDENFPHNETIYFTVETDDFSEFLIVCSTSHDHITLMPGTPIVDSVSVRYIYYSFILYLGHE